MTAEETLADQTQAIKDALTARSYLVKVDYISATADLSISQPTKYQRLVEEMHRRQSNQHWSNHVALLFFLHRIPRRDDPQCEHCPNARKTVQHSLFECPAYREHRRTTLDPLCREARSSSFLSSKIGTKALFKYIATSERFQSRVGVG